MDRFAPFLVIGTVVVIFLARFFRGPRRPPSPRFICAKCRKLSSHNHRTIGAWQRGKETFYCGTCHRAWLATQPHLPPDRPMPQSRSSGRTSPIVWLLILAAMLAVGLAMR
jgi:hypothetical protein